MNKDVIAFSLWICFMVFAVAAPSLLRAQAERAQSWTFEACATNNCIKQTLDNLSPDRARDAKLTTWGSTTYVWYRQ